MTCLEVRDVLPEFAAGVVDAPERDRIERHLEWCAGCRKEAGELRSGAATVAFALAPVAVPSELEDEVVTRLRRAAGAPVPRRARTMVAALVAALVAVGSLGWGAVMAGRAERYADRAARAEREQAAALERFQRVIAQVIPGSDVSASQTHLAPLTPTAGGLGGGFVLQLVSPTVLDFVMVIVKGMQPARSAGLPYRVRLVNDDDEQLRVGRIDELDADGGAEIFRQFKTRSLQGFTGVRVVDAAGGLVLNGTIDQS